MAQTHGERISYLEATMVGIKDDIGEIKDEIKKQNGGIQSISIEMPELLRKINEHHNMYNALKKAGFPEVTVMPDKRPSDGNGGYIERRKKKTLIQQFYEMPLSKKISTIVIIVPLLVVYWDPVIDKIQSFLEWIQALPH